MQIQCKACGENHNAVLTEHTYYCGKNYSVPVYSCENCGEYYIRLFSHGLKVIMQNGSFVANGNVLANIFADK